MKCIHCGNDSYKKDGHLFLSHPAKFECYDCNQPERSKREDHYIGGYFPPPWNPNEHPEKTKGWIAFQEEQRKDPKYYGCGALNTQETE
jgi:hypothetical protein